MRRLVALLLVVGPAACGPRAEDPATPAARAQAEAAPGEAVPEDIHTPARDQPAQAPRFDGPPRTVLVELFTSQGCNSCPPADALIGELTGPGLTDARVLPITFHVTYWDDLGWRDPFGNQLHDHRQIGYARQLPDARSRDESTIRGPYTPQMVVDGRIHFTGSLRDIAQAEIERASQEPAPVRLSAKAALVGASIEVDVVSEPVAGAGLDTDKAKIGVFAALLRKRATTEVPRGENAGKQLAEFNVVLELSGPKLFRSARPVNDTHFTLATPPHTAADDLEIAVFVQDLATLTILNATAVAIPD